MFYLRYVSRSIIMLCVMILSLPSWADCELGTNGSSFEAGFGNVIVQRDAAVGSQIAAVNFPAAGYLGATNATCTLYSVMVYNGAVASGIQDVYKTNVEGVGIKFSIGTNAGGAFAAPYPGNVVATYTNDGGKGIFYNAGYLVKTGTIVSGVLNNAPVAEAQLYQKDNPPGVGVKFVLSGESRITQVACDIKSGSTLAFSMGNVPANEFNSKGTVSDESKTVDLELDCDAKANVNITLKGSGNPDSTDPSLLALSNQGQNGVADGIGVQLLYNSTPLELNKMLKLKQSAGGQESFPITARYVQTKDKVKAGSANATATLDITYQ